MSYERLGHFLTIKKKGALIFKGYKTTGLLIYYFIYLYRELSPREGT